MVSSDVFSPIILFTVVIVKRGNTEGVVAELTGHTRAKQSPCQTGKVFPAKVSSFLTTEGNKTMVKRCLQFTIRQYKIEENSINHITAIFKNKQDVLKH